MKIAGKVAVYSNIGDRLYSVHLERARDLLVSGQVEVCDKRRGMVFGLRFLARRDGDDRGCSSGDGLGGVRYVQNAPTGSGWGGVGIGSGHRAFRHRDDLILPHRDAFLRVVGDCGAGLVGLTDDQLRIRRTCLLVAPNKDE